MRKQSQGETYGSCAADSLLLQIRISVTGGIDAWARIAMMMGSARFCWHKDSWQAMTVPPTKAYWSRPAAEVVAALDGTAVGLTAAEATRPSCWWYAPACPVTAAARAACCWG